MLKYNSTSHIMNKHIAMFIVFLLSSSVLVIPRSFAELLQIAHTPVNPHNFTFMVVGDWGRDGQHNQSEVATAMGVIGGGFDIQFVVSSGDNFYPKGLDGVKDERFNTSFIDIYTAQSLQKPWYVVLGNHDYNGRTNAQLNPYLRLKDKRWICHRSYVVTTGLLDIFFVDTTPFVNDYFIHGGYDRIAFPFRGDRKRYISNQLRELESAIQSSTAKWKIVVGHHTMASAGAHGPTIDVVKQLFPILSRNNVDFYFNGHDHCLQHIRIYDPIERPNGIQFVTSGGGSDAWVNDIKRLQPGQLQFYYDGEGFMISRIMDERIIIAFYDSRGQVLHQWTTSKL